MNRAHYYSGWFEGTFPNEYAEMLKRDITCNKSLVILDGCWDSHEAVMSLFAASDIAFEEVHYIDSRKSKSEAHELIVNASVILLSGGSDVPQMNFFNAYEVESAVKRSRANVIMGLSAGSINMVTHAISFENKTVTKYLGLGLDDFCYVPYLGMDDDGTMFSMSQQVDEVLLELSQKTSVYATCSQSFMRIKGGDVTPVGNVYLISNGNIVKK